MAHEQLSRLLFENDVATMSDLTSERLRLIVHSKEWPVLDVTVQHTKPVRFRFLCDNWDDLPPSIAALTPEGARYDAPFPGGIFNQGPHPSFGPQFICMRGSREYHTHPSHSNDVWANYRGQDGMNIVGILMQIADAWRKVA